MSSNVVLVIGRVIEIIDSGNRTLLKLRTKGANNKDDYAIKCLLTNNMSKMTNEYVKEDDLIGVKGHLQSDDDDNMFVFAERITFLSSQREVKNELC